MLTADDNNLVVLLSASGAGCSLDSSPGKNWVENSGGLPDYICKIAKGVMKSGKSKSSAIAIAVSRIKVWAGGGGDADADTKAKAAKALGEWNALKAKNKSKKLVKASREDGSDYLITLSSDSFNTEIVRRKYNEVQAQMRQAARTAKGESYYDSPVPYTYIRELWTDHLLVEIENDNGVQKLASIPYTVSGEDVTFGEPVEVEVKYVEVEKTDDDLNDHEKALLGDLLQMAAPDSPLGRIQAAMAKLTA
jgi:hypothetical protein